METTKFYKGYQTVVPSKIRKELNISPNEIIEWRLNKEKRTVELSFVKKDSIMDLAGIIELDEETNAVDLKHKSQKGEL